MARADTPRVIRAVASGGERRPSRTWESGRTCRVPGCGTRLSVYNGSSACSLHEDVRPFVSRAPRGAKAEDVAFASDRRWIA
jgi:hypothetical protein